MAALRIASYNIHRCIGVDGNADTHRIADVIRELDCDIVGLQEVDNDDGDTPASMRLNFIAAAVDMTAVPGLRLIRHIGNYGNALLTRLPVLTVRRHDLSFWSFEPRGALDVEMAFGDGTVRVIVTHFGLLPWERRHQTKKILEIVRGIAPEQTVVLLGDINEWLPFGRPLRWLHQVFGCPPLVKTFPSRWPFIALDRIWARPRGTLTQIQAHSSPLARVASDHLPVKASIAVPAQESSWNEHFERPRDTEYAKPPAIESNRNEESAHPQERRRVRE